MTDWVTISQVATAGGTLILAVATFASIRSSQHSARVAEQAMLAAQRPLLIPSREDDPPERIGFFDAYRVEVAGHQGVAEIVDDRLYLVLGLRNGGAGMAVIHGWQVRDQVSSRDRRPDDIDGFRRQMRDLYIPAGFTGFWQGSIRDPNEPAHAIARAAIEAGGRVVVDLLYGDQQGGQRAVARFSIPTSENDAIGSRAEVIRYWNIDGVDPRDQ